MRLIPAFLRKAFSFAQKEEAAASYPERIKISLAYLVRTVSHMENNTEVASNIDICARRWNKMAKIFEDLSKKPNAEPQHYQIPIHLNVIAAGIQVTHADGNCMIPSKSLLYIYDNLDFVRKVSTDFASHKNPDPGKVVSLFGAADARNPFAQNEQKARNVENFAAEFSTMMQKAVFSVKGKEIQRDSAEMPARRGRHFGNPG